MYIDVTLSSFETFCAHTEGSFFTPQIIVATLLGILR